MHGLQNAILYQKQKQNKERNIIIEAAEIASLFIDRRDSKNSKIYSTVLETAVALHLYKRYHMW
jgi:hypothetical protein